MTNKQIAWYSILSFIIFIVTLVCGGEYATDGFVMFMYYISLIGFYTFTVWGWVRLIKS